MNILVSPPTTNPIPMGLVRDHLQVSDDHPGDLLRQYLNASVAAWESPTGFILGESEWEWIPAGEGAVCLNEPLIEVLGVTWDGEPVEYEHQGMTLRIKTCKERARISYRAGIQGEVPAEITAAILNLVGNYFEHRSSQVLTLAIPREIPFAVKSVISRYQYRSRVRVIYEGL